MRPDPEDAAVFVDGREVSRDETREDKARVLRYEHYGIRRVVVRREGYVAHERLVTLDPPWYQFFPIDLVFDVFWPATIEDARTIDVKLEPRKDLESETTGEKLLKQANDFKTQNERRP
ncbi:hypothetical protein HY251_03145 [bacterium]|nr:hypothetical protein [bacterium]